MNEYTHHIKDNQNKLKTICGEYVGILFCFESIEHAYANGVNKGRLLVCKKCSNKIMEVLNIK